MRLGLFRRRSVPVPTWRGWLVLLVLFVVGTWLVGTQLYGFLAVNQPLESAEVLVVEGWLDDRSAEQAIERFESGQYRYLATTGVTLSQGHYLIGQRTWAELMGNSLVELGADRDRLLVCPGPDVATDRTRHSARALVEKLAVAHPEVRTIDVMTDGAHARRTRAVFVSELGADYQVGVISVAPISYDPERWWRSSEGVKTVMMEGIAWFWEVLFGG